MKGIHAKFERYTMGGRSEAVRVEEERYIMRRGSGESAWVAAEAMGLSMTRREIFEEHYRAQTTSYNACDSSSPRWAHDAAHTADVNQAGGYPALSESRWGRGKIAVCLPVIWPGEQAA